MKKRAIPLLLATVAATACAACGCGGDGDSIIILDGTHKTQEIELSFYGHKTDRKSLDVIEDVLQSFMAVNSDVGVFYEGAGTEYFKALDRRAESGKLDDVFMPDRDRLLSFGADGALADLTDTVNEDVFDSFSQSQIYREDGKIYAVPTYVSTYGLYVNYDLLQKHGKQVPRNFSEFTQVCDYFAESGIAPIVINNGNSLRSLILARGMYETYCKADTTAEIEKFNANPASLSAPLNDGIDFIYPMINGGWIDLNEAELTQPNDDLYLFAEGDRPFMIAGGENSIELKEILSAEGKALSYGIHAYPVLDSGSVLVAQADGFLSAKSGKNEAQAKKLVSSLTAPAALLGMSENQSCFSVLKGQTQIYADASIIPSASYLAKGKYVIGSDCNLRIPLDGILNKCTDMIIGGKSAQEVKARLADLLEEVGI